MPAAFSITPCPTARPATTGAHPSNVVAEEVQRGLIKGLYVDELEPGMRSTGSWPPARLAAGSRTCDAGASGGQRLPRPRREGPGRPG